MRLNWVYALLLSLILVALSCVRLPNDEGDLFVRLEQGSSTGSLLDNDRGLVLSLLQENGIPADLLDRIIVIDTIDGIDRIRELNLDVANLGTHRITSLPPGLFELKALRALRLAGNNLTNISRDIANLSNLRVLALSFNQITALPAEVGSLAELRELLINDNHLEDLPPTFPNLGNLALFNVDGNRLCNPGGAVAFWIDNQIGQGWRISQRDCLDNAPVCSGLTELTLLFPHANAQLKIGNNYEIAWCFGGPDYALNIVLIDVSGNRIVLGQSPVLNTRRFSWTPTAEHAEATQLRIEKQLDPTQFREIRIDLVQ